MTNTPTFPTKKAARCARRLIAQQMQQPVTVLAVVPVNVVTAGMTARTLWKLQPANVPGEANAIPVTG